MSKVKVVVFPVGQAPVVQEIEGDSLDQMQAIVGGWVQAVNLGAITEEAELNDYDLYCHEEGKLLGLTPNRFFTHDTVVGQFFISKIDKEGETVTLTDADIERIKKLVV